MDRAGNAFTSSLNKHFMKHLFDKKESRLVIGIMSGTSLDGINVAVCRLTGSGRGLTFAIKAFEQFPFPDGVREVIYRNSVPETSSVLDISQLNFLLGEIYADCVHQTLRKAYLSPKDIDVIGCHGQTIHHVPFSQFCGDRQIISTLQIGDASVISHKTGIPTIADFRTADMALGGQGAPLVPYLDYVLFSTASENRALLNLGGIGNITYLKADGNPTDVFAFDTGPANMIIDELVLRFFNQPFDLNGEIARSGRINEQLLNQLLADEYYQKPPPKSTGREKYNPAFVAKLVQENPDIAPADLVATATRFTAETVKVAYEQFMKPLGKLALLLASGGGTLNGYLMEQLQDCFGEIPVQVTDNFGVPSEAKEALCFAVLAHEFLNGVSTNMPSVTGASGAAILGKLSYC